LLFTTGSSRPQIIRLLIIIQLLLYLLIPIVGFFIHFSFLSPFLLLFYSEQYFCLIADIIKTTLELISNWKKVPLCSLLYYLLYSTGYAISILSIKLFINVSLIIGNIIDIYLLGIMVVLINWLKYSGYFGTIVSSYLLYIYLTRMELFLIILWLLESFSIIFQSLTLSNRLSINIFAGNLLISLLAVAVIVFSEDFTLITISIVLFHYDNWSINPIMIMITLLFIILLLILYSFEILNSFVQLFTFNLLTNEYLWSIEIYF